MLSTTRSVIMKVLVKYLKSKYGKKESFRNTEFDRVTLCDIYLSH